MLSGLKLADEAGVTPVTVSKIENGDQPEEYVGDRLVSALNWIDARCNLPKPDLIDLTRDGGRPESAAAPAAQHWQWVRSPLAISKPT